MREIKLIGTLSLVFASIACIQSCYSLSNSTFSPLIQTAKIANFPNFAPLQNPNLSQSFTIALQDVFDQRTKLNLTDEGGDIEIQGEITNYAQTATTVVSGDQAAQNRLTITVKVRYQNNIEEDKSFEKTFTDFADFNANVTLQQAENELVEEINERLVNQIYNAIANDW